MNPAALLFFLGNAFALILLPRKHAPIPLLICCCFMTVGQGIELGPFNLPVYRMILAVGAIRVLLRREWLIGGLNSIDKMLLVWAGWIFLASFFHLREPGSGPVYASGYLFNILLVYFLVRSWSQGIEELKNLIQFIGILLAPVAVTMILEHVTERNVFAIFGGVPEGVYVRNGTIRSQGPFQHPILAGTVGAVCLPLMIGMWQQHRKTAMLGIGACIAMTLSSGSSGPLMSLMFGVAALGLWRWRRWTGVLRYGAVALYLLLELVMSRPAYYVISKFDLTGSSTGWHRSRLIEAAIENFSDWWLFGTDYTVHWTGVSNWSERHADITNYYLSFAVIGGLPAMLLVVAMMWQAFSWVGKLVREATAGSSKDGFMLWSLGAALFAHAATSFSVSYFDQSQVFFWLTIALIGSIYSNVGSVKTLGSSTRSPKSRRKVRDGVSPQSSVKTMSQIAGKHV